MAALQLRLYGLVLVLGCFAATLLAMAENDDSTWMAVVGFISAAAIMGFPRGLERVRQVRVNPHAHRVIGLLVVVAVGAGLLHQQPDVLMGEAAVAVLAYVALMTRPHRGTPE